jgi:hypothetical protein
MTWPLNATTFTGRAGDEGAERSVAIAGTPVTTVSSTVVSRIEVQ